MSQCLAAGIIVVDHLCSPIPRLPRAGELVMADELPLRIGGCAANASIDLARVGVEVGIAGCVGDDPLGQFALDTLAASGVRIDAAVRRPGVATSGTLILNVQGEDRRFIHAFGANATLRVADIPLPRVLESRVFYLGGYLLVPSLEVDALAELFCQARRRGVTTVLDVALPGEGDFWPRVEPLLPEVDVFLPNQDEAWALTGLENPAEQARRFVAAGAGCAVITCGHEGSVLAHGKQLIRAGTYPAEYVGGTGAGDAFDAGYIAGLLAGEDPIGCLRWGSALGASCVRSVGATDSVFTRPEAIEFMQRHELPLERLAG